MGAQGRRELDVKLQAFKKSLVAQVNHRGIAAEHDHHIARVSHVNLGNALSQTHPGAHFLDEACGQVGSGSIDHGPRSLRRRRKTVDNR